MIECIHTYMNEHMYVQVNVYQSFADWLNIRVSVD